MKYKPIIWGCVIVASVVCVVGLRYQALSNQDVDAYHEQLRRAWAEGLPTDGSQFASTVQSVLPAENAAPFYKQLRPPPKEIGDLNVVQGALLRGPTAENIAAGYDALSLGQPILKLVDQAATKPGCWFDRDWSKGAAVLMPEYANMKSAAKLVALRGSLAAIAGDETTALANFREVLTISKHAGEEGMTLSALVAEAIYTIDLRVIASLCVRDGGKSAFRAFLEQAIRAAPAPNLGRENRDELFLVLWTMDASLTPAGRTDLGIKEEDLPSGPNPLSIFLSQPKSRIEIVRAARDAWAGLKLPLDQMTRARKEAFERRDRAMWAFPVGAKIFFQLSAADNDLAGQRVRDCRCRRLGWVALLRALNEPAIPKTIKTSDLLSPYDGRPLTYECDGKQIRISVHGSDPASSMRLNIPPSEPKAT